MNKLIYVDIDNTICSQVVGDYGKAEPWYDNIAKINNLYDEVNFHKLSIVKKTLCLPDLS